jgi:hypothetical protein
VWCLSQTDTARSHRRLIDFGFAAVFLATANLKGFIPDGLGVRFLCPSNIAPNMQDRPPSVREFLAPRR